MTNYMPPIRPTWRIEKPAARSAKGVVATQNRLAAEAGIEILAAGGNAVDAAVATALAMGVAEPWMSGIGGGGLAVVAEPGGAVRAYDFHMRSGARIDPARYPLAGGTSAGDLFGWPAVEGNRNLIGPHSICVPGAVRGLALLLASQGTMAWREVIAPAIRLAREGLAVDWFATLYIAQDAAALATDPVSRGIYLPGGLPATAKDKSPVVFVKNAALVATLERLAEAGPEDFYTGEIARSILADLAAAGSVLTAADFAGYEAVASAPLAVGFRGASVAVVPGLNGGPTLTTALAAIDRTLPASPRLDAATYTAIADAYLAADVHRFAKLGHAGLKGDAGHTSNLAVVDRHGRMVTLTNTLLSRFGSKVTLPASGVLMNNGMMWFDPRPGHANSIAPGVQPLANMTPTVVVRDGRPVLAVGAAGGRMIGPAIANLVTFHQALGLDLERAFHAPRIDTSTGTVIADERVGPEVLAALAKRHTVEPAPLALSPTYFAVPSAVAREAGGHVGMAHVTLPWAAALGEA